ncbi:MAG: pseudaminic acid synthase [Enterobacterales bacterium]|jgi:pseudaminic acid synthase
MNFKIDNKSVGKGCKPYVIAEMSGNHNGNINRALRIIDEAKKVGADAVKIQTYTPDTITIDCDNEDFKIKSGLWKGKNLYELYGWAHTPWEWHKELFDYARKVNITCFSSPFDTSAVDLLEDLNTPAYKIASFEIVDLPLIAYVAKTKKPMILSTGMANVEEITEAVTTAKDNGCTEMALLHCISGYPTPVDQSNIRTISDLIERFNLIVGLSDHTMGTAAAVASVALGAAVIEKHFTLNREDKGPDSEFSLEPDEFSSLCNDTRDAWLALGEPGYESKVVERSNLKFRRSLYVVKDLKKGDKFSKENVKSIRPGFGMSPKYYFKVLEKKAARELKKGTALNWDLIS